MLRGIGALILRICTLIALSTIAFCDEPAPLSSWIKQLAHPNAAQRVRAISELEKLGASADGAVAALVASLDDSQADVRLHAAQALGGIATRPEKIMAALVRLLGDADEHVRYAAGWSIARIAQKLDVPGVANIDQAQNLVGILRQAHEKMATHKHQARHRSAVDAAIAALQIQIASLQPPVEPQPEKKSSEPPESDRFKKETERLVADFRDADFMGRLRLLERLAAKETHFEVRSRVLTEALILRDQRAIRYASRRWGEATQKIYEAKLALHLDDSQLPVWISGMLDEMIPTDPSTTARLTRIAQSTRLGEELRRSALSALARKHVGTSEDATPIAQIAANRDDSEAVRLAAIDCLGAYGAQSLDSVESLLAVMRDANEPALLRGSAASAIGLIAPKHAMAIKEISNTLSQLEVEDALFGDFLEAISRFGANAIESLPYCVAGLGSTDEDTRLRSARAIEKLGPSATAAIPDLVERVVDASESVAVKVRAAKALKTLGAGAVEAVGKHLNHSQAKVREDVLRTLVLIGPDARGVMPGCIARLADTKETWPVRAAAASAIGAMREYASVAAPILRHLISTEGQPELRSAAIIALAQVNPSSSAEIAALAAEKDRRVRASAAFGLHLCNETKKSLELLIEMLNGGDDSELVEGAIKDIGTSALPVLLKVVHDPQAGDEKRLSCFRVALQLERNDWSSLLDVLGDENLGEAFYENLLRYWDAEVDFVPDLVARLGDPKTSSSARGRIERLIDNLTSELGAAGEEQLWEGGYALTQPTRDILEKGAEVWDQLPVANTRAAAPASAAPTSEFPIPTFAPLATSMETAADESAWAGNPRLVRVFYGTNRVAVEAVGAVFSLGPALAASLGIALGTVFFSVVVFLRLHAWRYALASIVSLTVVGGLGYLALQPAHRQFDGAGHQIEYHGGLSHDTSLGVCEVSIPENHRPGELEAPTLFRLEIAKDPAKHVVMRNVQRLERDDFYRELRDDLNKRGKNLLVFIHGYNVSFEDAARRTGQMAYDLEFPGAPVFFSWPSQANWYQYAKDKENIRESVEQIKSFLLELATTSEAETINLVAHSMGTVGLTAALQEIEMANSQSIFNQVVLAAPDIDAEVFEQDIAPKIVAKAKRVTIYTSQTDLALIASRYFNRAARVGDAGAGVIVYPGIDTIDASAVDTSLLGHSYYGGSVSVLHDVGLLLKGQPIEAREYLRTVSAGRQPYWLFDPTKIARQTAKSSVPPLR